MVDGADLMDSRTSSHFRGLGFDCPEIEFSCSQIRQCFQSKKLTAPGLPQWREIALRQLLQNGRKLLLGKGVQDNDSLSLFFIRDGRDNKELFGGFGQLVQLFFDLDVRHHLSADFAETGKPVSNSEKSVLFHGDN